MTYDEFKRKRGMVSNKSEPDVNIEQTPEDEPDVNIEQTTADQQVEQPAEQPTVDQTNSQNRRGRPPKPATDTASPENEVLPESASPENEAE